MTEFNELLGKTITEIKDCTIDSAAIVFVCSDNTSYCMYHCQDCCESVFLEDICGDIEDLLNSPLLIAEESSSSEAPTGHTTSSGYDESNTWTFYKLTTNKGHVTLRWWGSSNGYYSEAVDFERI
jgi:hypothetical protein